MSHYDFGRRLLLCFAISHSGHDISITPLYT